MKGAGEVRSGSRSFDDFARATKRDWDRLAEWLLQRYQVPAAVEVSDVRAELLLAAWQAIGKFDPARSSSIDKFVVWSAIVRAKRWIHQQRRALGKSCRAHSRHDISFAELGWQDDQRTIPAGQEHVVERELELARLVLNCDGLREKILVTAVWHLGSPKIAGLTAYADPNVRIACQFQNKREAVRTAEKAQKRIVELCSAERSER